MFIAYLLQSQQSLTTLTEILNWRTLLLLLEAVALLMRDQLLHHQKLYPPPRLDQLILSPKLCPQSKLD